MIVHETGADTRLVYEWRDDEGNDVPINAVELVITGDAGPVADAAAVEIDTVLRLHIPNDSPLSRGNYFYRLRAQSAPDWRTISAGLLRVR